MKFLTANITENKNPLSTLSFGELWCHFHSQIKYNVLCDERDHRKVSVKYWVLAVLQKGPWLRRHMIVKKKIIESVNLQFQTKQIKTGDKDSIIIARDWLRRLENNFQQIKVRVWSQDRKLYRNCDCNGVKDYSWLARDVIIILNPKLKSQ